MNKVCVSSFKEYLVQIDLIQAVGNTIILYRGQSDNSSLLPSIARKNPKKDTTNLEIQMLEDLKRRSNLLIHREFKNDWEWLVFAQHYGLKTRLLDWSSNPLIGLWFACSNEHKIKEKSFVYIFQSDDDMLVDLTKNESPFKNSLTKILRPTLNNERIIAQAGWFTAHKYHNPGSKFLSLNANKKVSPYLTEVEISADAKREILNKLSIFGINYRSIFPDISGLCSHLNWKYLVK